MAEGCKQLTSLDLSSCDKITDAAVEALALGCRQLNSLNLNGCDMINKDAAKAWHLFIV